VTKNFHRQNDEPLLPAITYPGSGTGNNKLSHPKQISVNSNKSSANLDINTNSTSNTRITSLQTNLQPFQLQNHLEVQTSSHVAQLQNYRFAQL